jgi:hypothetical protein
MSKFEWEAQLEALPLDRVTKAVGFALCRAASADGKDAYPGGARIAWSCGFDSLRSVNKGIAELRRLGLIHRAFKGGGRPQAGKKPKADEYWLATHDDVPDWAINLKEWRLEHAC